VIIPPEKLTVESIRGIAEAFIVRQGTDYGEKELSLEQKVQQLLPQLLSGEVLIVYDEASESVNLLSQQEAAQSV